MSEREKLYERWPTGDRRLTLIPSLSRRSTTPEPVRATELEVGLVDFWSIGDTFGSANFQTAALQRGSERWRLDHRPPSFDQ